MYVYLILFLIIIFIILTFNSLIKLNNRVKEAFSTMDVYLKKRWDLVPNIVEVVKGYSEHEKKTFEELVKLRNCVYDDLKASDKLDVNLKVGYDVRKLMALAEAYPDLKSSENFNELSKQLTLIENDIANARKYYNGTVRIYNNKVQMFPSNIIAFLFRFKEKNMFEANKDERDNVKVQL